MSSWTNAIVKVGDMNIVVLDLEMNQPSGRIIQIGALEMNTKANPAYPRNTFRVHVLPDEPLNQEIVTLTRITETTLAEHGIGIRQALRAFWGWIPGKNLMAWGSDCKHLIKLSEELGVEVPKGLVLFDLKPLAALVRSGLPGKTQGGLFKTMEALGLEFDGQQHDALSDAYNTALLAFHIISSFRRLESIKTELNREYVDDQ